MVNQYGLLLTSPLNSVCACVGELILISVAAGMTLKSILPQLSHHPCHLLLMAWLLHFLHLSSKNHRSLISASDPCSRHVLFLCRNEKFPWTSHHCTKRIRNKPEECSARIGQLPGKFVASLEPAAAGCQRLLRFRHFAFFLQPALWWQLRRRPWGIE